MKSSDDYKEYFLYAHSFYQPVIFFSLFNIKSCAVCTIIDFYREKSMKMVNKWMAPLSMPQARKSKGWSDLARVNDMPSRQSA